MIPRYVPLLICGCFPILLSGRVDAATPSATAVRGTVEIDGALDDVWSRTPKIPICTPVAAVMTVPLQQAARGHVRLLWDEDHIYLFYEVTDAQLSDVNGAPWEQDSVEFLIDENADLSPGYGADDCQYRINFRGKTTGGENFDARNIRAAVRETETGYQVEAAVKLRMERGAADRTIAADFQINDDPGNGKRQAVMKWSCHTDQSWNDTSGHGLVQLVPAVTKEQLSAAELLVTEELGGRGGLDEPCRESCPESRAAGGRSRGNAAGGSPGLGARCHFLSDLPGAVS